MSYGLYGILPRKEEAPRSGQTNKDSGDNAAKAKDKKYEAGYTLVPLQQVLCIMVQLTWAFLATGLWMGTTGFFDEIRHLDAACQHDTPACRGAPPPTPPPPLAHSVTGSCLNSCNLDRPEGVGICEGARPAPPPRCHAPHIRPHALDSYGTRRRATAQAPLPSC